MRQKKRKTTEKETWHQQSFLILLSVFRVGFDSIGYVIKQLVHARVMEHAGRLESTQEARLRSAIALGNSYTPSCSITRWCTLKNEPIVNY